MTFTYSLHQIIALAREVPIAELRANPQPGDLVIEPAMIRRDDSAIGWLDCHGDAPYARDNSGPVREIWDIRPLNGSKGAEWLDGCVRWENAEFFALPDRIVELARSMRTE